MADEFFLEPIKMQMLAAGQELLELNDLTAKFGLYLSEKQIQSLVERRFWCVKGYRQNRVWRGHLKEAGLCLLRFSIYLAGKL